MNYYEKTINSFLSSVSSNMSAVYLPAFFVSLIEMIEDYYKFDSISDRNHIKTEKTTVTVSYYLSTSYFLVYLLRIRKQVPNVKMAPTKGKTHDERFLDCKDDIDRLLTPGQVIKSKLYSIKGNRIIRDMPHLIGHIL